MSNKTDKVTALHRSCRPGDRLELTGPATIRFVRTDRGSCRLAIEAVTSTRIEHKQRSSSLNRTAPPGLRRSCHPGDRLKLSGPAEVWIISADGGSCDLLVDGDAATRVVHDRISVLIRADLSKDQPQHFVGKILNKNRASPIAKSSA